MWLLNGIAVMLCINMVHELGIGWKGILVLLININSIRTFDLSLIVEGEMFKILILVTQRQ